MAPLTAGAQQRPHLFVKKFDIGRPLRERCRSEQGTDGKTHVAIIISTREGRRGGSFTAPKNITGKRWRTGRSTRARRGTSLLRASPSGSRVQSRIGRPVLQSHG